MAGGSLGEADLGAPGFTPKDVDVAQIYDGFSASVIYGLGATASREGEALDFIQTAASNWTASCPLGAWRQPRRSRIHGLWHHRGRLAGLRPHRPRQSEDANVSFVGASAPIVTGTTFILWGAVLMRPGPSAAFHH